MSPDRDPLDLDDDTARLGRALYAEVRRLDAEERAAIRRSVTSGRMGGDTQGDDGACHGDHGGGCAGASE